MVTPDSLHARQANTPKTAAALLEEGSLTFQDREGGLEASDLCLAAPLPLFVGLRLGHAAVLQLCVVLLHSAELRLCRVAVCGLRGDVLVQRLGLLPLVLGILLLFSNRHLILLCKL